MDQALRALCEAYLQGELTAGRLLEQALRASSAGTSVAQIDTDRARRCGFPEVVFGEGKSIAALLEITQILADRHQAILVTRTSDDQRSALLTKFPHGIAHREARTFRWHPNEPSRHVGRVAVITAGTSDLPVAWEACETLAWMEVATVFVADVGVAGPHRLPARLDELRDLDAAVVVAGMEGALPSVVGGYLNCPVIGVPTSVGYGTNFGGVAPLLSMLNSCAANVLVVNIDAGFKGAYCAGMIARNAHATKQGA